MTTPIDTTRLRAHDELRKRLTAYQDAKALYESPDPYDREEARYEAMHVAGGRIGHDEALAQALLDEHVALLDEVERLRALMSIARGIVDEALSLDDYWDPHTAGQQDLARDLAGIIDAAQREPEEGGTR